jgi:hypothetical protein
MTEELWFDSWQEKEIFLLSRMSKLASYTVGSGSLYPRGGKAAE